MIRALLMTVIFGVVMYAHEITLPLDDGNIVIDAQFIRVNKYGSYVPELAFTLTNQTSSSWRTLKLQFDIGGLCNGQARQWTLPVVMSLGCASGQDVVGGPTMVSHSSNAGARRWPYATKERCTCRPEPTQESRMAQESSGPSAPNR